MQILKSSTGAGFLNLTLLISDSSITYHLKGLVEKGRKWWFEVKIEIAAIQLNIGTQAGFHVRNIVVHLFLDLRS